MIQNQEVLISSLEAKIIASQKQSQNEQKKNSSDFIEHCNFMRAQLPRLTPSERTIYELYLEGKSTKEVLQSLNIAQNTLKFHNKNIYSKLGVSSRKQLLRFATLKQHQDKKKETSHR